MSVLRRRYPPGMMSELQAACQASLSDLKAAFPDDTILANTSLQRFLQVGLCCMASAAWVDLLGAGQKEQRRQRSMLSRSW